jgi:hypothetical protein
MNRSKINSIQAAALVLLTSLQLLGAEDSLHGEMTAEDHMLLTVTAKVDAIDREKRELTLRSPSGEVSTVTVDEAVKRLDDINKGDEVNVKYYLSMLAELREPTAEEKKNPILISAGQTKAPKTAPPAVKSLRLIRAVATVEGLQRPTRLVTLKGPRGKYLTVKADDVKRMEKLHVGDTIVITFTEALAVAVEKAK